MPRRSTTLAGVLLLAATACGGPPGPSPSSTQTAPQQSTNAPPPAPSAEATQATTASRTPTPTPTPSLVVAATPVTAAGSSGHRTWAWTSDGPTVHHHLVMPATAVEQGNPGAWFVVGPDGRAVALELPASSTVLVDHGRLLVAAAPGPAQAHEISPLVVARWVERDGVRSLRVQPDGHARGWATTIAADTIWAELVRAVPKADTPGMRDQLVCHMQFAGTKQAWFLEPDRPAVGYLQTVAARCNPGNVTDGG